MDELKLLPDAATEGGLGEGTHSGTGNMHPAVNHPTENHLASPVSCYEDDLQDGGGFASYVESLRKDRPEPPATVTPTIVPTVTPTKSNGYNVLKLGAREPRASQERGFGRGGEGRVEETRNQNGNSPRRLSGGGIGLLQNPAMNKGGLSLGSGGAPPGSISVRARHTNLLMKSATDRASSHQSSDMMIASGGGLPGRNIIECTKFALGGSTPVKANKGIAKAKQWKSPFASRG